RRPIGRSRPRSSSAPPSLRWCCMPPCSGSRDASWASAKASCVPYSPRPKGPTRLGLLLIALAIALPLTALPAVTAKILSRVLTLATICLLGWVALTALHIGADLYLRRFRIDIADNLLARKHITQVRVLERVLEVVIVLFTIGFALLTFDSVRQFGVTL